MQITIDTANPLSDTDRQVLALLAGGALSVGEATTPATPEPAPKAAPKAAATKPAPKAAPKAKEPVEEPVEEAPAPAEPEDEPAEADGPTISDALARASELVAEQKVDVVKKALAALGVRRVSELKPDQVEAFLLSL